MTLTTNLGSISILVPSQNFFLSYAVTNDSTVKINGAQILLEEHIQWRAHDENVNSKFNLIEQYKLWDDDDRTVPNSNNNTATLHEDSAAASLVLIDDVSYRVVQLHIPFSVHESLIGRLIEIYHRLFIQVKTECCMSNLETWTLPIARYLSTDIVGIQSTPLPQPSAPFEEDNNNNDDDEIVEAMVLPNDWPPITADLFFL